MRPNGGGETEASQPPKVADVFRRGGRVEVRTWSGKELVGRVCDREPDGLLVDLRPTDYDPPQYVFFPWSSIEQVSAVGLTQRRVKFLPT